MLVLTRKVSETICIGDDIKVKIVRLSSGRVRLSIDAPKEVSIKRAELVVDSESEQESIGG